VGRKQAEVVPRMNEEGMGRKGNGFLASKLRKGGSCNAPIATHEGEAEVNFWKTIREKKKSKEGNQKTDNLEARTGRGGRGGEKFGTPAKGGRKDLLLLLKQAMQRRGRREVDSTITRVEHAYIYRREVHLVDETGGGGALLIPEQFRKRREERTSNSQQEIDFLY